MMMPNPIRSMTTTAKMIIIAVRGAATPALYPALVTRSFSAVIAGLT